MQGDEFDVDPGSSHGGQPAFSLHDPAFDQDPKLGALRASFKFAGALFGVAMTAGMLGLTFVLGPIVEGTAATWEIALAVGISLFVVGVAVRFAYLSVAIHRALRRRYGGGPG